jgi:uncharacterized protein YndB with AHSA1/START domain
MSTMGAETTAIEREITIAARPETVWEFFVDAEKACRWMGVSATLDPQPGGVYRVEVLPGSVARGVFVELDPPRRLVYTWGWESGASPLPPGSTTIEIVLRPEGDGTTVHFTHRDLPSSEAAGAHGHGWDHYFERLAIAAAGADPGADPWLSGGMPPRD